MEVTIGYVNKCPLERNYNGKIKTIQQRVPAIKLACADGVALLRPLSTSIVASLTEKFPSEPMLAPVAEALQAKAPVKASVVPITILRSRTVSTLARHMSIPTVGMRKAAQIDHW